MTDSSIDHPLRFDIVNELHARPFPNLSVPSHAVYMAIKEPSMAASRDRARDFEHLRDLLHRNAVPVPQESDSHFFGALGKYKLKWESHAEFVTYTAFGDGVPTRAFDPAQAEVFPADWLASAPGKRLVSLSIRVEYLPEDEADLTARLEEWFIGESLAVSYVLDGSAVIAGDFRLDQAGQMRFAVFVRKTTGSRRIGRIVQRLCEIETYRAMSMLGMERARVLNAALNALDPQLSELVNAFDGSASSPDAMLHDLLKISCELERLSVHYAFRFGATSAYEAIVNQRIHVLRENRFHGRQTFAEFMMRRYDPAMRTTKSAQNRLHDMALRAERAAQLLRTKVDVERSAQTQKLLESMDRRADAQLRLQHTVEGLSTVAISYYAVNLAVYIAYPASGFFGISKGMATAALTPLVILGVWLMVRRIRHRFQ